MSQLYSFGGELLRHSASNDTTIELKSAPSSPSRSPTPCRFKHSHLASRVSQGERRVSASWLPCTLTLDRWVPKWTPFLYAIFGLPPAQPLRLALVDPTDRYLRAWKPVPSCLQFDQQRVLSRFFSLFLPPPSSNGRLLHHHDETKSHD